MTYSDIKEYALIYRIVSLPHTFRLAWLMPNPIDYRMFWFWSRVCNQFQSTKLTLQLIARTKTDIFINSNEVSEVLIVSLR